MVANKRVSVGRFLPPSRGGRPTPHGTAGGPKLSGRQRAGGIGRLLVAAGCWGALLAGSAHAQLQPQALGVFEGRGDVGVVLHDGKSFYDPVDQRYRLTGSGANMWENQDQFHFVWKKMTGDFLLRTRAHLLGEGGHEHRKFGWIIRQSLDTSSPYVDVLVHGNGETALQYRPTQGAATQQIQFDVTGPDVLQLERKGKTYTASVAKFGDTFATREFSDIDLGDEVYVGIFVCAHDENAIESAEFENVRIVTPAPDNFQPYRDYYGSNLELMDVETGLRNVIYKINDSIQAPNWTIDGQYLLYSHRNGRLFKYNLITGEPAEFNTGTVVRNNNDHVFSFDGTQLGISSNSAAHQNRSIVHILPAEGGEPRVVTPVGHSYLHSWSPDAQWLLYTGNRDGELDIYKIPVAGGDEIRLTTTTGVDDGPEFTRDGEYIYFNSMRTGLMQLWRMKPDGSEQVQITDDEFNNWFPHISPDGKSIVFLSFGQDVTPSDHPFYKHIYLRRLPISGGEAKVIAYVYGGQGTINVPSWSPDGRRIAFISNTQMP